MHMRLLAAMITLISALHPAIGFASFSDTADDSYREAIEALQESGVVEGYEDGSFRPSEGINRAEFLKILLEARGSITAEGPCFPDVAGEWFAPYVCTAKNEGIVQGYPDGTFGPERDISFVEAAKILSLAYGQQIEPSSSEWYAPFARALEDAKAIPPSINGLSQRITRGEMAEMMWRISNGITDRPSKGYLNVKFPAITIDLSSDVPQTAKRCEDLAAFAESSASTTMQYYRDEMGSPESADGAKSVSAPQAAGNHSTTNVQVAGVDEADIVKTDGSYIYTLSTSARTLRIIRASASGDLSDVSQISFDGADFSPQDIYLSDGRVVVIGNTWNAYPAAVQKMMIYPPYWNTGRVTTRIYDVRNPEKPTLARTVSFDGSLVSSRRIEDKLYLIVNQGMPSYGPLPLVRTEENVLPSFTDSARGAEAMPVARCGTVTVLPHVESPQYLTIGVVDIDTDTAEVQRSVILGSGDTVYASERNLYVAVQDWTRRWDRLAGDTTVQHTNVFRFALGSGGAQFEASGSVDGRLLNQFSMDEHDRTFRIATTTDAVWESGERSNNLFVLNRDTLEQAGAIRNIAPGEQIYSVRFVKDRAYMVTFKTVDPLFVIDTSDARNPRILGKLKIPGYSSYLHPLDDNRIIGFGKEVDETVGEDLVHDPNAVHYTAVQGLKLALFDVTDVTRPKEIAKQVIGDRGSDSPLLYDHRALFFDPDRGILAFPASVTKLEANPSPNGPWDRELQRQVFQGAYVFTVDTEGFSLIGKATHYRSQDCDRSTAWSWCGGLDVNRILRIGETLFTVSDGAVQSHGIRGLTTVDELRFVSPQKMDVIY